MRTCRRRRVRYVDLYLRLRAGKLPSHEAKEIEALEEELEFHEIVFFRCSAIRQMQKHQVLSLLAQFTCFTSTKSTSTDANAPARARSRAVNKSAGRRACGRSLRGAGRATRLHQMRAEEEEAQEEEEEERTYLEMHRVVLK